MKDCPSKTSSSCPPTMLRYISGRPVSCTQRVAISLRAVVWFKLYGLPFIAIRACAPLSFRDSGMWVCQTSSQIIIPSFAPRNSIGSVGRSALKVLGSSKICVLGSIDFVIVWVILPCSIRSTAL